jgi:Bacterial conjugation TrbI-like protein
MGTARSCSFSHRRGPYDEAGRKAGCRKSARPELGASNTDSDIVRALRRGSSDSLNQTGQQIVRRNLNVQPTLTIRPGLPVRVIVNRDLVLAPYPSCGGMPCPS